jgi:hypothetical protein
MLRIELVMGPDIIAEVARVIAAADAPVDKLAAFFGVTRQTIYNWRNQSVRSIDKRQLGRILDPEFPSRLRAFVNGEATNGVDHAVPEILLPEPGKLSSIPPERALRRNEPPYAELLREHRVNPARLDAFKRQREEQKRHVHQGQLAARFRDFQSMANAIVALPNSVDEVGWLLFNKGLTDDRCYMAVSNAAAGGRPIPSDEIATMLLVERSRYLSRPYVEPVFRDRDRLDVCGVFVPLIGANVVYFASASPSIESEVKTVLVEQTFALTSIIENYLDEHNGKSPLE